MRWAVMGHLLAAGLLVTVAAVRAQDVPLLGTRPDYGPAELAEIPNAAAVRLRIWAPGLQEGYTPQGLALADGALLVAGYQSKAGGPDRGPCRVFRIDPATGRVTGQFAVPSDCGHAGGLGYAGGGRLYIVDTHIVLAVDLARALAAGNADAALLQRIELQGDVRGSLATWHDDALWIGSWDSWRPGALFRFPRATLEGLGARGTLGPGQAAARVELPAKAQGAAFDAAGALWISLSNTKRGRLVRLNPANGRMQGDHDTSPGIEGIAFAPDGRLWAVAEVGSQRWLSGNAFHPVLFALDPAVLK